MLTFLILYSLNFDNQIPIHISTIRSLFVLIFFLGFLLHTPPTVSCNVKKPVLTMNCNLDLAGLPQLFKPEHKTVVEVLWPF